MQRDIEVSRTALALRPAADIDTKDAIFQLADMAAPQLPGPVGDGIGVAKALADMLFGTKPSETQQIIAAVQAAVKAAVDELETFISDIQIANLTADIQSSYRLIYAISAKARDATNQGEQMENARGALTDMQPHIDLLRKDLFLLPKLPAPSDLRRNLQARAKGTKVMAHGAVALFTLDRLKFQYLSYLSLYAPKSEQDAFRARVNGACVDMKIDVLGVDRNTSSGDLGDFGELSAALAFYKMNDELLNDRMGAITYSTRALGMGTDWVQFTVDDAYDGSENRWSEADQSWYSRLEQLGVPLGVIYQAPSPGTHDLQMREYRKGVARFYDKDEDLPRGADAVTKFVANLPGWDKALADWNRLLPDPTPSPHA